ncbi:hypothetical protein [Microbacterium aurum]
MTSSLRRYSTDRPYRVDETRRDEAGRAQRAHVLPCGRRGWALLAAVFAASALGATLIAWRSAKGLDAANRRVSAA